MWGDLVTDGKIILKTFKTAQRELLTGSELAQRSVKWGNL